MRQKNWPQISQILADGIRGESSPRPNLIDQEPALLSRTLRSPFWICGNLRNPRPSSFRSRLGGWRTAAADAALGAAGMVVLAVARGAIRTWAGGSARRRVERAERGCRPAVS